MLLDSISLAVPFSNVVSINIPGLSCDSPSSCSVFVLVGAMLEDSVCCCNIVVVKRIAAKKDTGYEYYGFHLLAPAPLPIFSSAFRSILHMTSSYVSPFFPRFFSSSLSWIDT